MKNYALLLFVLMTSGCITPKVSFLVSTPPEYEVSQEVKYVEIQKLENADLESSIMLMPLKSEIQVPYPSGELLPSLGNRIYHNTNSFLELLRSALVSKLTRGQRFELLRDHSNQMILGVVPNSNEIVKIRGKLTSFEMSVRGSEPLKYVLVTKKGNLPFMERLTIEGVTLLAVQSIEANNTGFEVRTPYVEKISALKAEFEIFKGNVSLGSQTYSAYYVKKHGGQQETLFASLTSHLDWRFRTEIIEKFHQDEELFKSLEEDLGRLELAVNDPEEFLARGYNLIRNTDVPETQLAIRARLVDMVSEEFADDLLGQEKETFFELASGDSTAVNLIKGYAYEEAIRRLESIEDRSPSDTFNLAIAFEAIGDKKQAIRFYVQASKMDESFTEDLDAAYQRFQ